MPTRSFVLAGPEKKFWDISWDGPMVEITSGKWGTNGRAREAAFESVAERDAFIAAEIKKVTKKGYRESGEVAPAPDIAVESNVRAVAALRERVIARKAPAWLPVFAPGESGVGVVRGPMTLDRGEAWPTCPVCHQPLTGLFELDLSRVPAAHLREDSVVQLFWCEAWEDAGPGADVCTVGGGYLARRHARGPHREDRSGGHGAPFAIVDWQAYEEVPYDPGDLREAFDAADASVIEDLCRSVGAEVDDDPISPYHPVARALGLYPRNEHKLGGYPTFVQDYERAFAHQIFQIEAKHPFDVNFGDIGAGHLLLAPGGAIDFFWASH